VNNVSTEVLNKAYRLAYFLHQDKGMAIRIVAAATLKLNVAMAAQSKRLYYVPVGRVSFGELRRTDAFRNKALFSDLHLLQRLIYGESEPYERQKEQAAQPGPAGVRADGDPANEDDLLVYFIKHLVRITTKRNAFYVTLGVSRLLHSYSTLETMEIYNAVIGEPERVKDDYYYRSRKAVLMQEMYQRFGQLIRACRQRRGEERFETQEGSSEQRSLVRECLRLFTPWDTTCPVPRDFDPFRSVIARLTSNNGDDENKIEVNRIHAVLHPDCFGNLVAAFGYSSPEERMELPRFFADQTDDQSPPKPRRAPAELSTEELAEINNMLAEQSGRRRRSASNGVLRILVDGIERARLNPVEQSSISFSAGEDAETIEVKTTDLGGDLLLATHLLTACDEGAQDEPIVSSIRLEGGQELALSITRRPVEASGAADLLVTFGYRETHPRRAAGLLWQRVRGRFNPEQRQADGGGLSGVRVPALIVTVMALLSYASYLAYVSFRSPSTSEPAQVSSVQPPPPPKTVDQPATTVDQSPKTVNNNTNETEQPAPKPARSKNRPGPAPAAVDRSPRESIAAQPVEENADDATRSGVAVPNLKLSEVRKIYIDMRGDAASDVLRDDLIKSFGATNVVSATTNAEEADASLKIVVSRRDSKIEATARLVNARGTVLWPKSGRGTRRYAGETSKVISEMIKDLISEISR
jgi:hypothetical protein